MKNISDNLPSLVSARLWPLLGLLLVLTLSPQIQTHAQDSDLELAEEYFGQEDYEKARVVYDKLGRNARNLPFIYKNYLETLLRLKDFKETERLVTRQIKSEPDNPIFRIDFGRLYQEQGRADKAQEEY
ncbi:MAG: hypothetical protein HC880_15700, partial [Bacteroidia bacterium]|nr:hypothetical protein [Bacteroidia bacterium]